MTEEGSKVRREQAAQAPAAELGGHPAPKASLWTSDTLPLKLSHAGMSYTVSCQPPDHLLHRYENSACRSPAGTWLVRAPWWWSHWCHPAGIPVLRRWRTRVRTQAVQKKGWEANPSLHARSTPPPHPCIKTGSFSGRKDIFREKRKKGGNIWGEN